MTITFNEAERYARNGKRVERKSDGLALVHVPGMTDVHPSGLYAVTPNGVLAELAEADRTEMDGDWEVISRLAPDHPDLIRSGDEDAKALEEAVARDDDPPHPEPEDEAEDDEPAPPPA